MIDMLQKTENVAKNVANKNSQDLTEQWKKGELPERHYYIKTHNETIIDEYIQWYKDHGIPSEKSFAYFNIQQVLAPVPTFDEWQAKLEENAQLKELLKEIRQQITEQVFGSPKVQLFEGTFDNKLLAKIDEVLK